jgi:hypothetical protein
MTIFKFKVQWDIEVDIDAIDEDEAYEIIYGDVLLDAYGRGKGSLSVDLVEDIEKSEWGLFDTDPEEEPITYLALNDEDYL